MPEGLAGRIALVTGASRGIGAAAALALGAAGAKVIATARTQGGLEELDDGIRAAGGPEATLAPLDLMKPDGLDQLGLEIFQRHGRLDILVHAAGMLGGLTPVAHVSPALWDRLVSVNLTSAYRLIRSFDPLLRASDRGRAMFITQTGRSEPFWGAYAATKAGMEALVRAWADEVDGSPARAILIDPGPTRTALRRQAFPGEDTSPLADPTDIAVMVVDLAARSGDPGPPTEVVRFSDWRGAPAAA
ncbi:MAG TPA: SDR family NAD(P)-dependent oxidoreductase [Caulobacteraceae bacterium]|jgi:NAD(P)-dependent dehydrogenase (short-subunit alcohol dehydrogenase family)